MQKVYKPLQWTVNLGEYIQIKDHSVRTAGQLVRDNEGTILRDSRSPLRSQQSRDRAEKRLRMCGLSWRAQPGNNNKPYKNGGVFKIFRVASSFSRKSRVCLKIVD